MQVFKRRLLNLIWWIFVVLSILWSTFGLLGQLALLFLNILILENNLQSMLLRYCPWTIELGGLLHCGPYCCLFWLSKASSSSKYFLRFWKLLLLNYEFFRIILISKSNFCLPPLDWICYIFFFRFYGTPSELKMNITVFVISLQI